MSNWFRLLKGVALSVVILKNPGVALAQTAETDKPFTICTKVESTISQDKVRELASTAAASFGKTVPWIDFRIEGSSRACPVNPALKDRFSNPIAKTSALLPIEKFQEMPALRGKFEFSAIRAPGAIEEDKEFVLKFKFSLDDNITADDLLMVDVGQSEVQMLVTKSGTGNPKPIVNSLVSFFVSEENLKDIVIRFFRAQSAKAQWDLKNCGKACAGVPLSSRRFHFLTGGEVDLKSPGYKSTGQISEECWYDDEGSGFIRVQLKNSTAPLPQKAKVVIRSLSSDEEWRTTKPCPPGPSKPKEIR